MKFSNVFLLVLFLVLLLTSCEALFITNLFGGFESPPSASDIIKSGGVDAISVYAESDKWIDSLADNPEEKKEITDYLDSKYDTSADTGEEQNAATLHAKIELETTAASEAVNNVSNLFFETGGSITEETMIGAIIPDSVKNDRTAFDSMLDAFDSADDAYSSLGSGLQDGGGGYVSDQNVGEVAQSAAVAIILIELIDISADGLDAGDKDELWNHIHENPKSANYDTTDPFAAHSANSDPLHRILEAAGLASAFGL